MAAKKVRLRQRAGFPMARDCGGTSFVTTVPAEDPPRANGYSGRDYGSMRNPDVVADAERAACALAPVGQSHHSGNHATLTNGDQRVSLDGGVVEVRAISYSDFGSGVTDEFGGNHSSNKPNPVSQPNCAFIFDAHGTISVDTSASFTVSEKDCAANEGYDAAKRMAGISLKALEEAPYKMRVGLYGRCSAFPCPAAAALAAGLPRTTVPRVITLPARTRAPGKSMTPSSHQ